MLQTRLDWLVWVLHRDGRAWVLAADSQPASWLHSGDDGRVFAVRMEPDDLDQHRAAPDAPGGTGDATRPPAPAPGPAAGPAADAGADVGGRRANRNRSRNRRRSSSRARHGNSRERSVSFKDEMAHDVRGARGGRGGGGGGGRQHRGGGGGGSTGRQQRGGRGEGGSHRGGGGADPRDVEIAELRECLWQVSRVLACQSR